MDRAAEQEAADLEALTGMTTATTTPTHHGSPVVAAQGLTKRFKDFWLRDLARAVDHLSFEIYPHEVFGLLGPNGSGKSTTIKMILGLLRPTSGRLAVFGKPPTDVGIKKRIGYLPEESYLYGFLTARETLEYYAKLFGIDRRVRTKRIDELLEMVGLSGAQFRPVHEFSKGMQRRIGLAQALINDPDFLILDEPTTGLDPIGTRQVKDLIIQLGQRGKTVLLSSHLLADVEDCVDRMVILYGGRKRDEGTCDALLVAHNKTTIVSDALDEQTISAIDELIRARSAGERSIITVDHPRQRLEEKFLEIVEQAREEKQETSGAEQGGQVAEFLTAPATGAGLIEQLMTDDEQALPPPEIEPAQAAPSTPQPADPDLIAELLRSDEQTPPQTPPQTQPEPADAGLPPVEPSPAGPQTPGQPAPAGPRPTPPAGADLDTGEVDTGLISSLLDDDDPASEPDRDEDQRDQSP